MSTVVGSSDGSKTDATSKFRFPSVVNDQLEIDPFLMSSKFVIELVDDLGTLFKPLSYDMSNNVIKISEVNETLQLKHVEQILLEERRCGNDKATESLLWLKRALHFFCIFFQCVANDTTERECLKEFMATTYKSTLEPYHGWVTRQLFNLFKNATPSRSTVLNIVKNKLGTEGNLSNEILLFTETLECALNYVTALYDRHNLNQTKKAP